MKFWRNVLTNLRPDQYLSIFFVAFIILTLPFFLEKKFGQGQKTSAQNMQYDLIQIGTIPVLKDNLEQTKGQILEKTSANNILAIDVDSATTLIEKNSTASAFPASTTKMMTALVARKHYDLDQVLQVSKSDLINGNRAGFVVGESIRVEDLLNAMLIGSNNEAASILANGIEGGAQVFVDEMNRTGREMGLTSTLFVNTAGFDNENIKSTARDLSVLARELIKDEYLKEIVAKKEYWFESVDGKFSHLITNTNQLLFEDETVRGLKTGTTEGAGEVLVTLVERPVAERPLVEDSSEVQSKQVLVIVMGSKDRYADTRLLIDWIFDSYEWTNVDLLSL